MRPNPLVLSVLALALTACSAAPDGSSPPPPDFSPGPQVPGAGPWLGTTFRQAIPPIGRFSQLPGVTITQDGLVLSPGAVPAIFPGPLVIPMIGREISAAGRARILDAAREAGLLSGRTDFSSGPAVPGQVTAVLRLTVDGVPIELTRGLGDEVVCDEAVCNVAPGSPEAFSEFWRQIHDLPSWLGSELGAEGAWEPAGYALLVGPAPVGGANGPAPVQPAIADWPLPVALGSFGQPIGDGQHRCATVAGEDAVLLGPALRAANQLTQWVQDPSTSATFGLTVRPLLPDENVCRDLFGV